MAQKGDGLDEYLLELYFKDYSKAPVRSLEIVDNQVLFIQESDINGLHLNDGGTEDSPIPTGFIVLPGSTTCPIWVGTDTFKIMLKMYTSDDGIFAHMIKNVAPVCLMMNVKLNSVCGISTLMSHKYWIKKEGELFSIDSSESALLNIDLEEPTHAD